MMEEKSNEVQAVVPKKRKRLRTTILSSPDGHIFLTGLSLTLLFLVWLGLTLIGLREIVDVFTENPDLPGSFIAILGAILIAGWLVWTWFGYRFIWRWWQYHLARREILFINKDMLIVRRPVSILGLTDAYDMGYVTPLFYHDKHSAVGFEYGSRTILFAANLPRREADWLIVRLNDRYFPGWNEEDEDED